MSPAHGDADYEEAFVRFVQLALDDAETGAFARRLAAADADARAKLLTQTAAVMRAKKEPEAFVKVVERLRDPKLLARLIKLLDAGKPR